MEHQISALTNWLNAALSSLTGSSVHLPDQGVMAWFIAISCLLIFPPLSRRFSADSPGKAQHLLEIGMESVNAMLDSFIGKHGRDYFPVMGGFAFFILTCNLITNVPGFQPPTADLNGTVALALLSFLYYNYIGFKTNGAKYLQQFVGDPVWLAPLMIPIELLSHISRPLSLSVRLFGNIFGEHTLAGVFFFMLPLGLPVVFAPLGIFVSFMQAFVFTMLSMIYIAGALEHGH
jgi:F-type H+-transporting ATPase subunit a